MSKTILFKRSSVTLDDGTPKLPDADSMEYGELALNFAEGVETISTKNSNNEMVTVPIGDSGVAAGTYGPDDDATTEHGETITVPSFTVDSYGRLTEATDRTITLPDVEELQALIESLQDRVTVLEGYHTSDNTSDDTSDNNSDNNSDDSDNNSDDSTINDIGNIVLYNTSSSSFIHVDADTYTNTYASNSAYTPIGIIAVSADMAPDGVARVMALKYGNCSTPDTGSTETSTMYWGYNSKLLGTAYTTVNYVDTTGEKVGTNSYAYFPRDEQTTSSWATETPAGLYWYGSNTYRGADPVEANWFSKNELFYADGMATNDFDGTSNTQLMLDAATSQPDWKTDDTITNSYSSGYYPSACVCWRYSTDGTSQGDWYLPSVGEALFMNMFRGRLNTALDAIIAVDSSLAAELPASDRFWSSSEYSSSNARLIHMSYGYLNFNNKNYSIYVRPFAALSI